MIDDIDDDVQHGEQKQLVRKWAGKLAQSAAQTMQELTSRKYNLPDKNVASQLLMYRQVQKSAAIESNVVFCS